uniref:Transcriptional regulator, TraR/DksA family n=1 Tax=Solibacter usitatus (strain Ellin6076) TaxID=234267 RepID=Q021M5_SOLUE
MNRTAYGSISSGVKAVTPMTRTELKHFRSVLHAMLDGTEDTLRTLDDIAIQNVADSLDRIQHATEREMAIRRIELDFSKVQSVRSALQRIAEGTYGVCSECDNEIPGKRLKAVPWTPYCLDCQDSADRRRWLSGAQMAGVPGD